MTTSSNPNNWGERWEKWKAERSGKGGTGIQIQTYALLAVTAYFTATYLFGRINNWIVAGMGVFAIDIGAILWSKARDNDATNKDQHNLADALFKIDALGMVLTTLAMLVDKAVMPEIVYQITEYGVPAIIVINALGGLWYWSKSDQARLATNERNAKAELDYVTQRSNQELKERIAVLHAQKSDLENQSEMMALQEQVALLEMQLDATRRGQKQATRDGKHVDQAAEGMAQKVISDFRRNVGAAIGGNGHPKSLNTETDDRPKA